MKQGCEAGESTNCLQGGYWATPGISSKPILIHNGNGRTDRESEESGTDDVVLCGGNEVDMTEYLESRRKALGKRGMRVSITNTQWMECRLKQADR